MKSSWIRPPGKPTDFQAAVSAMLGKPGVCGPFQITYWRKMVIMMITKTMGIIIIVIITSFALYSHAWNIVRYKPTCDLVTCNVLRVTFSRNSDHHEKRTAPQIFAMFLASSTFKKSPPTPALRRAQHVRGTSKRFSAMRKMRHWWKSSLQSEYKSWCEYCYLDLMLDGCPSISICIWQKWLIWPFWSLIINQGPFIFWSSLATRIDYWSSSSIIQVKNIDHHLCERCWS